MSDFGDCGEAVSKTAADIDHETFTETLPAECFHHVLDAVALIRGQ
jgi:hypothetical protein